MFWSEVCRYSEQGMELYMKSTRVWLLDIEKIAGGLFAAFVYNQGFAHNCRPLDF